MFRIRRVYDDALPVNRNALVQVRKILAAQFNAISPSEIENLGEKLRNPVKHGFRAILLIAENDRHDVLGFALLFHEAELHFLYLDYIATGLKRTAGGIGGALYENIRNEAVALGCRAVFFECLPDEPEGGREEKVQQANAARLRFYERWGARPLAGTAYETPVSPEDRDAPFLVVDNLDADAMPSRAWARKVVQAILERKYAHLCPPAYNRMVLASIQDDPIRLRPFKYIKEGIRHPSAEARQEPILLTVNDRHEIHHIRERGYVEAPARISRILEAIEPTGWFEKASPKEFPLRHITAVHDPELVAYLKGACEEVGEDKSLYPYVFPIRNKARLPKERSVLAGYFCIDTFTPIHRNAFRAAKRAVDCTLTAAEGLIEGRRLAYSLVRPPGHHAEKSCFGGFCYFNNGAVAANFLSQYGRVAILDIDYHHGNGQQDIFYSRPDVLTVSLHGNPKFAYPYFTGFEDEKGAGPGDGFNVNIPLPESLDGSGYRTALRKARERILKFSPGFLVVSLGLDPAKGDPTGTWSLSTDDFRKNGCLIGEIGLPTLVVQEGGYRTRTLGANLRAFFEGVLETAPR